MKMFPRILAPLFVAALMLSAASCVVVSHHDNGKHKGWYKNTNNPHNPATTNPGKAGTKAKSNGNGNGNGNSKAKGKK